MTNGRRVGKRVAWAIRAAWLGGAVAGCGGATPNTVTFAPPSAADGWRVSTPRAQGTDSARLAAAFHAVAEQPALSTVRSLLVARHGALVAEGYFGGADRTQLHDLRSVIKSVTALLVGIAIARGELPGVRVRMAAYYPREIGGDADPALRAITLEDLLTMRAGLGWDEHAHADADPNTMYRAPSSVGWVLRHAVAEPPGRVFRYSTGNSQLVAGVLARATGRSGAAYAQEYLFRPLGITRARWDAHGDGITYGGVRLFLTARDLAKLGQLCLQDGWWAGRQVVPAWWVRAATRPHARAPEGPYGYAWWVRPLGYAAAGYGGQYVYVLPADGVVVVLTADPNAGRHLGFADVEQRILRDVVRAVRGSGAAARR